MSEIPVDPLKKNKENNGLVNPSLVSESEDKFNLNYINLLLVLKKKKEK